ncbi:MAG: hypothetical protein ACE5D7_10900, partial [Fidelibacterota bacterium]
YTPFNWLIYYPVPCYGARVIFMSWVNTNIKDGNYINALGELPYPLVYNSDYLERIKCIHSK